MEAKCSPPKQAMRGGKVLATRRASWRAPREAKCPPVMCAPQLKKCLYSQRAPQEIKCLPLKCVPWKQKCSNPRQAPRELKCSPPRRAQQEAKSLSYTTRIMGGKVFTTSTSNMERESTHHQAEHHGRQSVHTSDEHYKRQNAHP